MFPTGVEIKRRRKELGLSLRELGDKVGKSHTYIADIENGKENVSDSVLLSVCGALGLKKPVHSESPIRLRVDRLKADVAAELVPFQTSIDEGKALLSIDFVTQDDTLHGDVLLSLSRACSRSLQFEKAIEYATKAQIVFSTSNNVFNWCVATLDIGDVELLLKNYTSANVLYRTCETKLLAFNGTYELVRSQVGIALVAAGIDDYDTLRQYHEKAEQGIMHVPETKRQELRARNCYMLAHARHEERAFADAISLFSKAYVMFQDINDNVNALRMLQNIGEAYLEMGELDVAYMRLNELLALKMESDQTESSLAKTRVKLAHIKYLNGNLDIALADCMEIAKQVGVGVVEQAEAYRIVAKVHFRMGNSQSFKVNMTKAASLLKQNKTHRNLLIEIQNEYMLAENLPELLA